MKKRDTTWCEHLSSAPPTAATEKRRETQVLATAELEKKTFMQHVLQHVETFNRLDQEPRILILEEMVVMAPRGTVGNSVGQWGNSVGDT